MHLHPVANNNNNHNDIYSAVIMTEVIVRVHSVHLVNVEQRQAADDSQNWTVCQPVLVCYLNELCDCGEIQTMSHIVNLSIDQI